MRLFIAINIPDEVKEKISEIQAVFKKSLTDVKWVEKDNFHLTLKFLGEAEEENIGSLISVLSKSMVDFKPFNLSFSGIGAFPDIKRPRVIWAGIKEGESKIKMLVNQIEDEFEYLGFKKEKRIFSAHLTLGRVRSLQNISALSKKMTQFENINIASFNISKIDLMQSILASTGAQYKCLKSIFI